MPNYSGSAAPTSNVWDVSEIYETDVNSREFKELLVRLYQNLNLMANVLDSKDSGVYDIDEFSNGQQFFPDPLLDSSTSKAPVYRPVIRKVINFGALPNNAETAIAHGITFTTDCTMTRMYAVATDSAAQTYIPIPFVGAAGGDIELRADGANVYIRTTTNRTMYNRCIVVLEYIKT